MINNKITIMDATKKWVNGFNAISSSLIERAFNGDTNSWIELTQICEGKNLKYNDLEVYVWSVQGDDITICFEAGLNEFKYLSSVENGYIEISSKEDIYIGDTIQYLGFGVNGPDLFVADFDDENIVAQITVGKYDLEGWQNESFPTWGTLWTFNNNCDEEWARENIQDIHECGFRVFEDQHTEELYLYIDGIGYDFYEEHWKPLYKARGLNWHNFNEDIRLVV